MKTTQLIALSVLVSSSSFAAQGDLSIVAQKYRKLFDAGKGLVWDMNRDDNVYFDCDLINARDGSSLNGSMGFKVTHNGVTHQMETNLDTSIWNSASLIVSPSKDEIVGATGDGEQDSPLQFIAIRVGKEPISIQKPFVDHYADNNAPAERMVMVHPLYIEISEQQFSGYSRYHTRPLSVEAKKNRALRVKSYGVCYFSKYNSQLNNSGVGYPGNTKDAWSEPASSPWSAHSSPERPF